MEKIALKTPEPEKALPILLDALERHKALLTQSLARTEERIQHLTNQLQVDPHQLLLGAVPHPEDQDLDLLELEGELELKRHLQEQLASLDRLKPCP